MAETGDKPMFNEIDLVEISDKLGLIQALKLKLIRQPDPAAAKLSAVLSELSKTYVTFEDALLRYLALTLEPEELSKEKPVLLDLEGGKIITRMREARGHSGRIENIYNRYLSPWFRRVLNDSEVAMMKDLFMDLSHSDGLMLNLIDAVAEWLAREAQATLDLVNQGKINAAQQRVRDARKAVSPARGAILAAMLRIYDIEADFIKVSGAI